MIAFVVTRLLSALLVVAGVVCLVFLLLRLVPGDPVDVMLGESARPADRAMLRHELGLDESAASQLGAYLWNLTRLDLGQSVHSGRSVVDLLAERLPATVELAALALLLAVVLAVPLGVLAALRKDSVWDVGAMSFSLLGVSIPNFWLGPLLILLFSVQLGWTPVSGRETAASYALPALTLGTAIAAVLARMVRSSLLEVLGEDFVRTARAKGLGETRVIWNHALRNAWLPIVTLLGLQLGALLGGAVITETVFSWPGIGSLLVESIHKRDYMVVQGCVLVISLTYVVVNTLTDLLYAAVDPRIRIADT
jgi:peptide/nickel transport system permease protein